MAIGDYSVTLKGDIANADLLAKKWHYKIVSAYIKAAKECYDESQRDAPVGETGDLKASGEVGNLQENGPGPFSIEVAYGGGIPFTQKDYNYPGSAATTQYPAGEMEADTYPWFVELGHLSRAGNVVPAQPFLGPNFDFAIMGLEIKLDGILDR
jgi:hypothetical protein